MSTSSAHALSLFSPIPTRLADRRVSGRRAALSFSPVQEVKLVAAAAGDAITALDAEIRGGGTCWSASSPPAGEMGNAAPGDIVAQHPLTAAMLPSVSTLAALDRPGESQSGVHRRPWRGSTPSRMAVRSSSARAFRRAQWLGQPALSRVTMIIPTASRSRSRRSRPALLPGPCPSTSSICLWSSGISCWYPAGSALSSLAEATASSSLFLSSRVRKVQCSHRTSEIRTPHRSGGLHTRRLARPFPPRPPTPSLRAR